MAASIFSQFLGPSKSVADYTAEMDAADARRESLRMQGQQNALNALTIQDTMEQRRQATEDRNILQRIASGWTAQTTAADRIASLRNTGRPSLMQQADALEKADLDRQKTGADVGKANAETLDAALKRYRGGLDYVTTRDGAQRWFQAQYADPVVAPHVQRLGTLEQSIQSIPTDPAAFQQWRQQVSMGLEKYIADQRAAGESASTVANRELIPDGKGGFVINAPLIDAKKAVAKSGAAKTQVSVNSGQKGFENEMDLRSSFKAEPVYKAHQEMTAAHSQIRQALAQGTPVSDLAAATKIMKLLDPGSVVRESELGMSMAATGLLDRAQNFAANIINGTKLTPKQRQEFGALADALMSEAVTQYNSKHDEYVGLGSGYGLNAPRAIGPRSTMQTSKPPQQTSGLGGSGPQRPPQGKGGTVASAPRVVDFGSLK